MPEYTILLTKRAAKELDRIPNDTADRIIQALEALSQDPRPSGCKKLRKRPGYRIRVGDYRVIYEIHDNELIVLVLRTAHRKDIYR